MKRKRIKSNKYQLKSDLTGSIWCFPSVFLYYFSFQTLCFLTPELSYLILSIGSCFCEKYCLWSIVITKCCLWFIVISKFAISSFLWVCVHPSCVEVIVVVVWLSAYPSCVEMIVVWLCALSLLCRGDCDLALFPYLLCRGDCDLALFPSLLCSGD